ncbi:uncharacterized protein [Apostichopus japonicus]|uniref:uncharacterized protein isoform X2 n=1 Tax=Stichopus japonicus TaxID=307972 RepID=UPI003AB3C1EA
MASKPSSLYTDANDDVLREDETTETPNEEREYGNKEDLAQAVLTEPELVENTTFFSQGTSSDDSDGDFFDAKDDIASEYMEGDDDKENGESSEQRSDKEGNRIEEKVVEKPKKEDKDGKVEEAGQFSSTLGMITSVKNADHQRRDGGADLNKLEKRNSDLWGNFEPDVIVTVGKNDGESPKISATLSSVSSSASVLSQTQSVSTDWVQFEDKPSTKRSHSSLGIEARPGSSMMTASDTSSTHSKIDWVKFDDSPRPKRHQISQEFTGSSSVYSGDVMSGDERSLAETDRQSVMTSSAISSHGSYSGSQEYFPLEVSPSSSTGRIADTKTGTELKTLEEAVSTQHVSHMAAGSASTPTSSSEKISSSTSNSRSVSSPTAASWVKFEREVLGAVPSSSGSENSSPVHRLPTDVKLMETGFSEQATLPLTIFLGVGPHLSQMDTLPSDTPLQDVGNVHNLYSSGGIDTRGIAVVSPSPSNPFREDVLRQQQLQKNLAEPNQSANPFVTGIPSLPSCTSPLWETFTDNFEPHKVQVPSSPGNPFSVVEHVTVHQPGPGPYSPSVNQSHSVFDETDFAAPGAEPSAQTKDQFPSMSDDPRSNQLKVVPTATVSPVRIQDTAASIEVKSGPSQTPPTGFVQEYPRLLEDPEQGWSLMLRFPDKKKLAGSREWKSVHARLIEGSVLQFFNDSEERDPFKEIALQCNYEFSPLKLQPYDAMGKIHTIKLLYASFKEKRKLSAKGFHTRVVAVEQLLKVGSQNYESFRNFIFSVNEVLMKLSSFKSGGSHYHNDSITITVVDSYRTLLSPNGDLLKQAVHVDIYCLAFLSGKSECAIGLNDMQVKGAEVVSKRDIIPNKTDVWIKMELVDLHKCCNKNVFVESRFIRFDPVDACRFKLLSFETKPKECPELPLLVKAAVSGEDVHIQFRVDLLAPDSKVSLYVTLKYAVTKDAILTIKACILYATFRLPATSCFTVCRHRL